MLSIYGVGGIVVSIAAFQAVDPGSIPGRRIFFVCVCVCVCVCCSNKDTTAVYGTCAPLLPTPSHFFGPKESSPCHFIFLSEKHFYPTTFPLLQGPPFYILRATFLFFINLTCLYDLSNCLSNNHKY